MNDLTRQHIIRLKGGTYCDVFRYINNEVDYIIKIFGDGKITKHIGTLIIQDYNGIKNTLEKFGVPIPKSFKIYFSPKSKGEIVIIEQYCGVSVREVIRDTNVSHDKKVELVRLVEEFITKLPEGVPLDTNPGNFVINNKRKIYFVDLIPPEPWKYKGNELIQQKLINIFPTMRKDNYSDKYKAYHLNKYRKVRFNYHCKRLFDEIKQ